MADIRFLTYPVFQAFDDNGNPLSGGKVNVYSAGTTDRIDTWNDADKTSKNANPVVLNSRGEADIWFDAPAKIVLTDSDDVTVKTIDDVSPLNTQTLTGQYNLLKNGSFELDGDGDGKPDNWDIVETTSTSTVEIDTSTVAHGSNSLKFVSGGGGGGTATTSEKFPVSDGESFGVNFFVASTTTTATNKVDVIFYDSAGTNPSTTNVYTSGGTSPSTLTRKAFSVTTPANKTQAEVKLSGVTNATSATTYFDHVQALDQGYLFSGTGGKVTADAADINNIDGLSIDLSGLTATSTELNLIDGYTGTTADMNSVLTPYASQRVELGNDFATDTQEVVCERIGNLVTVTSVGTLSHSSSSNPSSTAGDIPSSFRPDATISTAYSIIEQASDELHEVSINTSGTLSLFYNDYSGSAVSRTSSPSFSISYLLYSNIT